MSKDFKEMELLDKVRLLIDLTVTGIDTKEDFEAVLGMVTDYWSSAHNADPIEIFNTVLDASKFVNGWLGKAVM